MTRKKSAGFTLLELLLVMVILGVMASMAIGLLRFGGQGDKPQWGKQFERQFGFASDVAVLAQKQLGLQFNTQEIRFLIYLEDKWQTDPKQKLTKITLPKSADVTFYINHRVMPLKDKFEAVVPQVLIDNSLEYTPFELHVQEEEQKHIFKLSELGEFVYEITQ